MIARKAFNVVLRACRREPQSKRRRPARHDRGEATPSDQGSDINLQHKAASFETAGIECAPLTERYRSGHNGTDSKSVEGITSLRGFESLPLRHSIKRPSRARAFLLNGRGRD
jgi:hypothetical protein